MIVFRAIIASILILCFNGSSFATETTFAVATVATPVLNTPDFSSVFGGSDGNTLRKDACGQIRALEFVALPGTVFTIEAELKSGTARILKVTSADYPYPAAIGYFIDSRSVLIEKNRPPARIAPRLTRETIIAALRKRSGSRYVWGGNISAGIPQLLSWYPPLNRSGLKDGENKLWQLAGVDCSGLLYEATGGYTPRNTSALVNFGTSVAVRGMSQKEISSTLKPLDLIVWQGHVLIVIDAGEIIESRLVCSAPDKGVRIRPLAEALKDVMKTRTAADELRSGEKKFVVRRWY